MCHPSPTVQHTRRCDPHTREHLRSTKATRSEVIRGPEGGIDSIKSVERSRLEADDLSRQFFDNFLPPHNFPTSEPGDFQMSQ